ncbi:MAG: hypothetical protein AAB289_04215, partial [Chloroflexota bacterium]
GIGRYENLLQYAEAFDDATSGATWAETNLTPAANSVASPNGTTTADTLTVATGSPGQSQQVVTTTVTLPYTFSVWAKAGTGTNLTLELTTNGGSATTDTASFTLTSAWQRYSVSKSAGAGTSPTTVTARIKTTNAVGETLYVWGAQLEQAGGAGVYVRTTATAVTASQGAVSDGLPTLTSTGSGTITAVGDITSGAAFSASAGADGNSLYFEGTGAGDATEIQLTSAANPGSDIIVNLPSSAGTLVVDGTAITDVEGVGLSSSAGVLAVAPTELSGSRTFGDASTDTIVWTWDRQTGTDVTMTVASGAANFTGLQVGGASVLTAEVDGVIGNEAPLGAQYLVAATDGTLTAEDLFTDGLAIDSTNGVGSFTVDVDPTELSGSRTFGDASTDTIVWTWDRQTGTDV